MFKRIPQPPLNPALRDTEKHRFWPAFTVVTAGALLVLCGARHVTSIETTDGNSAWETQLVKAFSSGGLQYPQQVASPPPPNLEDPAAMAAALDRWAKKNASAPAPSWKVRIDTSAATPCPT